MTGGSSAQRDAVLARRKVSRETAGRLDAYETLLRSWQARTNLVAPSTLPDLWERHFEEGLVLGALVPADAREVVDLGSGGGLPGLVLAILAKARGSGHVTLVESNGKKAAFLRTVARELALDCTVRAERIEVCGPVVSAADAVTARALAPLETLLEWVQPHLGADAVCLFPKGRGHGLEVARASQQFEFDMVKHSSTGEPESVVLELRALRRRA